MHISSYAAENELDSLLHSLLVSVDAYKTELKAHGLPPPSSRLAHPWDNGCLSSPKAYEAKRTIIATLGLLNNVFTSPFDKLTDLTHRTSETASLQLIARLSIPTALSSSSSPTPMTIEELAERVDVHPNRLGGPMRLLAANGWFDEVEDGVFCMNKMSAQLRDGRDELCWARHSEFCGRTVMGFAEASTRPTWRNSTSPLYTGAQIGHQGAEGRHMFELVHSVPERHYNFMHAIHALEYSVIQPIVMDFPWTQFAAGHTIVDVGGGNGGLCVALSKQYPHLNYIIQDLPKTVLAARTHIAESGSGSGGIEAEAHDFFTPQSVGRSGDGYSFSLKWVLHNWPDAECVQILTHLATVIGQKSRIIIIDNILTPSTLTTSTTSNSLSTSLAALEDTSTYTPIAPPPFVPKNFGNSGKFPLMMSVMMTAGLNASERTLGEFKRLFEKSGLEIVRVHTLRSWVGVMELRKKA